MKNISITIKNLNFLFNFYKDKRVCLRYEKYYSSRLHTNKHVGIYDGFIIKKAGDNQSDHLEISFTKDCSSVFLLDMHDVSLNEFTNPNIIRIETGGMPSYFSITDNEIFF